MAISIDEFEPEMFDEIYTKYLDDGDSILTKADWCRLYTHSHGEHLRPGGYVLLHKERIVGSLGMLFSRRVRDGQSEDICNVFNWYVDKEFRGQSLALMRPVIRLQDHTLTDFTPTARVCAISERLGFQKLDSTLRVLLPLGERIHSLETTSVNITDDVDEIRSLQTESEQAILDTHQTKHCHHSLLTNGDEHCYVVTACVKRYAFPYAHVLYVSNDEFFRSHLNVLRRFIRNNTGSRFLAIDNRRVGGWRIPYSFRMPFSSRQLYRSNRLAAKNVDGLYSELAFLGLSTMPSMGYEIRRLAKAARLDWIMPKRDTELELDL